MPRLPSLRLNRSSSRFARSSDRELVAACLSGEADAWDALIERYERLIYTVLLRTGLTQSDAEDLFQDVCLILLNHLGDLRDTERLASWLISTTKREAWRRGRRRGPSSFSELAEGEWETESVEGIGQETARGPEESALALEEQLLVQRALERLPERCRDLLTLLYCKDPPLSYADTAERLALPVGSIGPQRARCLQKLQKLLQESGF